MTKEETNKEEREYWKVGFEPRGFRDVYWCWNLNEPFVVSYRGEGENRKRFCENCNAHDFDDQNHVFICSIYKPHWHKTWDGVDESEKKIIKGQESSHTNV